MEDFLKMDIFFAVATLATVLLAGALLLLILRVYRILGHVERISEEVAEEAQLIRADVSALRADVRKEGYSALAYVRAARRLLQGIFRRRRK